MVGDARMAAENAPVEGDASRWSYAAHTELAFFEADRGNLGAARRHADLAVAGAARSEAPWDRARAVHALAYVLVEEGKDLDAGIARYAEAAEGYRRAGDLRREAITLVNRGATFASLGRFADALDCLDLAIEHARAVGNHRSVAVALENRGAVRRMLGDHEPAEEDLATAINRAESLRFRRLSEAARIERLYLALATGAPSLRARRDEVLPLLAEGEGSPHADAALAVVLRATHALGEDSDALRATALARTAGEIPALTRAELFAAAFAVRSAEEDAEGFLQAVKEHLGAVRVPEDRAVRRRGITRRFVVPEALRTRLEREVR